MTNIKELEEDINNFSSEWICGLKDKLMSKVKYNGECIEWLGGRNSSNKFAYGRTYWKGRTLTTHRASYAAFNGAIPEGAWVLHRCDNPICINPDHLYLGDRAQNSRDIVERNRHGGSKLAKIREDQVDEIRKSSLSNNELAAIYNVHRATIRRVRTNLNYKAAPSLDELLKGE